LKTNHLATLVSSPEVDYFDCDWKAKRIALFLGTDVMTLKIFSPKYLAKILAFFTQLTASFITLVFEIFFRRIIGKNAENCVHNIGPR
jgi:hypothetical protein